MMILIELLMTMTVMTLQKHTKAVRDYAPHLQILDQHSRLPIRSMEPNAHQVPNDQSYHHSIWSQYFPTPLGQKPATNLNKE